MKLCGNVTLRNSKTKTMLLFEKIKSCNNKNTHIKIQSLLESHAQIRVTDIFNFAFLAKATVIYSLSLTSQFVVLTPSSLRDMNNIIIT